MQYAHCVRCAPLGTTPFSQNAFSMLPRCWPFDVTELARERLCKETTVCAEIELNCNRRLESGLHGCGPGECAAAAAHREKRRLFCSHSCHIVSE